MKHRHHFVSAWECHHTGTWTGDISTVNYNVTYNPVFHHLPCSYGRMVHVCRECGVSDEGISPGWKRLLGKLVRS